MSNSFLIKKNSSSTVKVNYKFDLDELTKKKFDFYLDQAKISPEDFLPQAIDFVLNKDKTFKEKWKAFENKQGSSQ